MSKLHINYAFLLDYSRQHHADGVILDYGCGEGDTVVAGRAAGLNAYGVELFFGGSQGVREAVEAAGLLGSTVREIENGVIPFDDNFFDLIFSNQVFEHVEDLSHVLGEIHRVLKPGGVLLSLFPSRDSIREGHCGIPMAHWFSPGSKAAYLYMLILRKLGLGYFHKDKRLEAWVRDFMEWMTRYCFYRTLPEIRETFANAGFSVEHTELSYIRYRLEHTGRNWLLPAVNAAPALSSWLFRKLGHLVLLSRKL